VTSVALPPLAFASAAALANLAGAAAVAWRRRWSDQALESLIALSAGFMISVALTAMLPEALATGGAHAALVALVGYLLVHLTQHTLAAHFHFGEETHQVTEMVSVSALVGLLMHTFVDGVAIASGFRVSDALGELIFVAILMHKFPEGLAISSLFLASGATRLRALGAACALGVATLVGFALTGAIAGLAGIGLALSAGVTLYVSASNLVPEIQARGGRRAAISFFVGAGLFFAARSVVTL
jgi:ZIP family zinc transporter/zinc and cadmium transporter